MHVKTEPRRTFFFLAVQHYLHQALTSSSAVTAVYKGSPRGAAPAMLRSYDSRREPPPDFDCKIWQAGRATSAIGLAFKPIQIGQSMFHDDGVGTFNPAPEALDEAVVNEWPGRDVGVFVSVGTGKRPRGSDNQQQMWYEGFLGEFAEARRRLISKIEGCERIHEYMLRDYLFKRNVSPECYFRLNVEIGVGEFGMNEWNRLGDISTGTRRYMARDDEQRMLQNIAVRLARIHRAKIRWERTPQNNTPGIIKQPPSTHFDTPFAVELPGDVPPPSQLPPSPRSVSFDSGRPDSMTIGNATWASTSPRSSYDHGRPATATSPDNNPDRLTGTALTPAQYRQASGADKIAIMSPDEYPRPPPSHPTAAPPSTRVEPPPLPPKTPLPDLGTQAKIEATSPLRQGAGSPPYPLEDEAPPPVNMARKPAYRG